MRIIVAVIILSIFLPFFASALELPPSPKVSPLNNIFSSLRNESAKIESYITPESAKEKGLWVWIKEESTSLFSRAVRASGGIYAYIKNKSESATNEIEDRAGKKISEIFWSPVENFIKNFTNYIDLNINK